MVDTLDKRLKEHFGHEGFRLGQRGLIEAVLGGRDVMGVMPTGGGKSVCYQLPAMIFSGVSIVISPLISLMKDQIHALTENGIAAAYINSSLSESQIDAVLNKANAGEYKIIYVAPERLMSLRFLNFCFNAEIPLVAVDEAHCVSHWGQDFRLSYLSIPEFIGGLKKRPVVAAFTATATERVRADVINILQLKNPLVEVSGFNRENLFFEVRHPKKRYDELIKILTGKKGLFGIVYCSTRKETEDVSYRLNADGFNSAIYHAGLSSNERHLNQDGFIYDKTNIIVATNAFGMGIDKSNVSFVIHYNMPKDLESYYQEAGRAGRDGMPADCILLYSGKDLRTNLFLIENAEGRQYESEEQKAFLQEQERRRLKDVDLYCQTNSCLRNYILKYFGEKPLSNCGSCGNCLKETDELDITVTAQKILSCVARTKEFYGKNTIIEILRGSKNNKLLRIRADKLSTYGICSESEAELKEITNYLIEHGYLTLTDGQYPVMLLGERAGEVLRDRCEIKMPHDKDINMRGGGKKADKEKSGRAGKKDKKAYAVDNPDLYAYLKTIRRQLAERQGVPAYVIFHDSTLAQMCVVMPKTLDEFSNITGVGTRKKENYGDVFIAAIKSFTADSAVMGTEELTGKNQ